MPDIPLLAGRDGARIPAIGFGTAGLRGDAGTAATASAIDAGYRLIDTAFNYDNEGAVGAAVRRAGVPRDALLYSTKVPGRYHARDLARAAIEESLLRSGLDHLDLVLIHWPNPSRDRYVEAWQAMVEAREAGLVRMIGVSNFLPEHLDRIVAATGVTPVLNQIELHPYCPQDALRAANAERGVLTQAWSPLRTGLLEEPVVVRVAESHDATPAQVLLAWSIAVGAIPLPKSTSPDRQAANLRALDLTLTDDDLAAVATLARPGGADPRMHEEL